VAFNPDGQTLAWGTAAAAVRLSDPTTGTERAVLTGHTGNVVSVAFSPDGQTLASASLDGTVRLWDRTTGQERAAFKGHTGGANCVAFAPDGLTLASASGDIFHHGAVQLWDVPPRAQ
jgi:WD40 repeat protein